MSVDIEVVSEEVVSVKSHIIEGRLEKSEGGYCLYDVVVDGEKIDVPLDDVFRQYQGQDIRIVVVSLEDAERLYALAQEVSDARTDG